jgi:hypothetical protein
MLCMVNADSVDTSRFNTIMQLDLSAMLDPCQLSLEMRS